MVIDMHAWSARSLWLPWPLHHLHLPFLIPHYPQPVPSTIELHPRLSSKSLVHFTKEMGSIDESFSNTGYEPKDYFFTETYVEFNQESMTEQRFPEQRFLKDVDYEDAAIGGILFDAYREQVYHSQREGLSVGLKSSSMSNRTVLSVGERGDPLSKETRKHRLGLCSTNKKSKFLHSVKQELTNTNFKPLTTEEVY